MVSRQKRMSSRTAFGSSAGEFAGFNPSHADQNVSQAVDRSPLSFENGMEPTALRASVRKVPAPKQLRQLCRTDPRTQRALGLPTDGRNPMAICRTLRIKSARNLHDFDLRFCEHRNNNITIIVICKRIIQLKWFSPLGLVPLCMRGTLRKRAWRMSFV